MLNVVKLRDEYRQDEGSNIITLAYDIRKKSINENIFNVKDDLTFIKCLDSEVITNIIDIYNTYKDLDYHELQILVPMYKGINGIDNLNKILQDIINPKSIDKKELVVGDIIYRENDKVLQLINMPDERIFNGDIGTISKIENKDIIIDYDGNEIRFTPANFSKFKHGYAISIHKSQGSEFDTVVLPITSLYNKMLYRKLYYTAVTRSKKKLIIIGDINALKLASSNDRDDNRRTTIKDYLIDGIE
jgi:exodeoxyribonuclease V alpha subunit